MLRNYWIVLFILNIFVIPVRSADIMNSYIMPIFNNPLSYKNVAIAGIGGALIYSILVKAEKNIGIRKVNKLSTVNETTSALLYTLFLSHLFKDGKLDLSKMQSIVSEIKKSNNVKDLCKYLITQVNPLVFMAAFSGAWIRDLFTN